MTKQATRIAVFWTGAHLSVHLPPWEWAFVLGIKWFSRPAGKWLADVCHMGVAFEFDDGSREIHEALFKEGWTVKPFEKLAHFAARDPHNLVDLHWLADVPALSAQSMYNLSLSRIGWRYDRRLIGALAVIKSAAGRIISIRTKDDPLATVCSEGASQLIYSSAPQYDMRVPGDEGFQNVTPQSARDRFYAILRKRR